METETDKKIKEMARESFLMRREIAVIAIVFFLIIILVIFFVTGSLTLVQLPY
jgi:uncharacterized membrane protein YvbJ